ncbi:UvrD-helicase domain-containing protein [Odoribacter sp. OttesenSCG-928-J03]|nr:UvrD-helicase domain-containing protein [Odoribacter sp. OttesenSCG-928-J03]MDL2330656.1 UvrD-helicase domain-containing protein [Odoribacter sp. OttesenSCG-928-A06]
MSQLNIYKASAGSGKTFSLTLDYFKLIFRSPHEYRNILAVTFTNKATEEMKSRIINELHKLAENRESSYAAILKKELELDDDALRNRAQMLRTLLLHDYGHLSVTTIDRFFQRIVKSFTKELGIFPGYNVELDNDYILVKAVDKLMEAVRKDVALRNWVLELMNANVEDGKSWSVKGKIADLGSELFKENYMLLDKKILEKFNDKVFLKEYQLFLHKIISEYENELTSIADQAIGIIDRSGLTIENFKNGKKGCVNHFYKLRERKFDEPKPTAYNAVDNIDSWITKTTDQANRSRIEAVFPELNALLKRAVDLHTEQYRYYLSAIQIDTNLYQLGILNDLYKEVRNYCEEKGVMLLSDTTHILNLLVAGNDTSFLFEKTGNHFKHIMIDEFQDTSSMQWQNFRPLLVNTLSQEHHALIVGDVKQSIYRWRNGDWTLLAHKVQDEFDRFGSEVNVLGSNWRSTQNIVRFNNVFFREAATQLKDIYDRTAGEGNQWSASISQAYDKLEQQAEVDRCGYVDIQFGPDRQEEESASLIMSEVTTVIEDIIKRGGLQKEIVVLVRSGKEGEFVANYFMEYNQKNTNRINFVSNDSLYINASSYVKFIVAILKYIVEPYDAVNKATALFLYKAIIKGQRENYDKVFNALADHELFQLLESNFTLNAANVMSFSLFETIETIIDQFDLRSEKEEIAYLIAFQDIIYEYELNNSNNILLFLEWWEKEQHKKVLTTSEDTDAVRILTIHKSKGLEFGYVILPFCSWELDPVRPVRRIWCEIHEDGFNQLEYIPLNYSAKLSETIFDHSYYDEHLKAYVDNLNLLYVALTRARNELYLRPYAPKKEKSGHVKDSDIGSFLYKLIDVFKQKGDTDFTIDENNNLTFGEKVSYSNPEQKQELLALDNYPVNNPDDRIVVKYNFKEYNEPGEKSAVNEGKLLHEIFKSIRYKEDIDQALEGVYRTGLITQKEVAEYRTVISKYLENPQVSGWFGKEYTIINERDILLENGAIIRPDRVMLKDGRTYIIDYKFGQKEDARYIKQLQFYKKALQKMGYPEIHAYIWYVTLDKIINI